LPGLVTKIQAERYFSRKGASEVKLWKHWSCWGTDQVLGKASVREIHPFLFNAIRPSFALLFILAGILLAGGEFGTPRAVGLAALSGIIGELLAAEIYFVAMRRNPAHITISVGNTDPLWGALGAAALLGEGFRSNILASLLLVLTGTFMLAERSEGESGWRIGILLTMLVAVLWGLSVPLAKMCLNEGMTPLAYQAVGTGAGVASCAAFWLLSGRPSGRISRRSLLLALASGFLAFFLGFVLWLGALGRESASALAPFLGGKVAFGFILSAALLRERVSARSVLGACLIVAGMAVVTV